jgi:E3 SUMO-protein ligase PIAS1
MAAHRQTIRMRLRASDHPILSRVVVEPSLRVMVFCAADGQGRQDVAFPHQSEIKVNGGDIKANLRGLKNKPGSTRPVDITNDLRLKIPSYVNNVEMTYALTTKASGDPLQVSSDIPTASCILYQLPFPSHAAVKLLIC